MPILFLQYSNNDNDDHGKLQYLLSFKDNCSGMSTQLKEFKLASISNAVNLYRL